MNLDLDRALPMGPSPGCNKVPGRAGSWVLGVIRWSPPPSVPTFSSSPARSSPRAAVPLPGPHADWPPNAKRWYDRGLASYRTGEISRTRTRPSKMRCARPEKKPEVRLLAARCSAARLDYDRTIELLKGVEGTEARGVRGRALWYQRRRPGCRRRAPKRCSGTPRFVTVGRRRS